MSQTHKLIPQIIPGQTHWTVKVIVAEKSSAKTSRSGSSKYLKMLLVDTEGNKVQATIFDPNIAALESRLVLSKTYLISNATVKYTPPQFREVVGEVQWTLSGTTRIQEIEEDHTAILSSTYVFTPFKRLQEYMDLNTDITIIGAAIDMRPKRMIQTRFGAQSYVQDIVLVDQKFDIAMLTMWDGFVENECTLISDKLSKKPIVMGKQLKASSFNGLSISTKPNSSFIIDAPFEQVADFSNWVDENVQKINDIVSKKGYYALTSSNVTIPSKEKLNEIRNIEGLLFVQNYFWLKATAEIDSVDQSFWYMSCSNCNKSTYADFEEVHYCSFCRYSQARATPRARAFIKLQDSSGSTEATAIGEPAEKLLQCSAIDLMKQTTLQGNEKPPITSCTSNEQEWFFYIKSMKEKNGEGYKSDIIFILPPYSPTTDSQSLSIDGGTSLTPSTNSVKLAPPNSTASSEKNTLFLISSYTSPENKKSDATHSGRGKGTLFNESIEDTSN